MLKVKVCALATKLFDELASSAYQVGCLHSIGAVVRMLQHNVAKPLNQCMLEPMTCGMHLQVDRRNGSVQHGGLTFAIECLKQPSGGGSSSGHISGSSDGGSQSVGLSSSSGGGSDGHHSSGGKPSCGDTEGSGRQQQQ